MQTIKRLAYLAAQASVLLAILALMGSVLMALADDLPTAMNLIYLSLIAMVPAYWL